MCPVGIGKLRSFLHLTNMHTVGACAQTALSLKASIV